MAVASMKTMGTVVENTQRLGMAVESRRKDMKECMKRSVASSQMLLPVVQIKRNLQCKRGRKSRCCNLGRPSSESST